MPRSSAQLDRVVVKFNTGKSHGIKNVSTEQCVIAPAGMNERGSLKKVLGGRANDAGLEDSRLTGQKCLPSTPSAIPLDSEWEFPRTEGADLLLAYEKIGYDKILPGHLPDLRRRLLFREVSY